MKRAIGALFLVWILTQSAFASRTITSSQIQVESSGMLNPTLLITGTQPWDFTDQDYLALERIDEISVTLTLLDGDTDSGEYDEGQLVLELDGLNTGLALNKFASDVTMIDYTVSGTNLAADLLNALQQDGMLLGSILDLSPNDNYVKVRGGYIATLTLIDNTSKPPSPLDILYVDDDAISDPGPNDLKVSDPNEDGSEVHPFDSIQEAINAARDHVTIRVSEGRYVECLNFMGKNLHVIGFDANAPAMNRYPMIDANEQGVAVTFNQGEDANCLLSGFVLTRGLGSQAAAIACIGSSPTLRHCLIVGNRCKDTMAVDPDSSPPTRAVIYCVDSHSLFEHCTIADNYGGEQGSGICVTDCNLVLSHSIVWGNRPRQIQVVSGHDPVVLMSSLDTDPLFGLRGDWVDANDPGLVPVEPNHPAAVWLAGDYHVQSLHGRYNPSVMDWVYDDVTSDCIDLGDPNRSVGQETAPHGDRLNAGAYGGTWMASRTGKLVFVAISDPGFQGEMSKYEITNAQYCQFLNETLSKGFIVVYNDRVYGPSDTSHAGPFFETYAASADSQIDYQDGAFVVRTRDGYHMANHPVVKVSWYGATAYCIYHGYRLPTSEDWEAVADYDGSFTYGCGLSLDQSKANYAEANPLGLTSTPYTSPVGYYPSAGYGLCDLAGNVEEWTSSASGSYRVARGGNWRGIDITCAVWSTSAYNLTYRLFDTGFRVCR
ncbi:MAG: formylglycine-generating enzyme family protein [Phycisphaerae bacterium]|nr:formylglycine-generating enzyme family protein [Phycisphaerae bacterium]